VRGVEGWGRLELGDADSEPSELSVGLTTWNWSGWRARSLAPRLPGPLKLRPAQETSVGLFGGPTACEASEPLRTGLPIAPSMLSVRPKGSLPLNVLLARPSQKLSRLKAAATIGGVFRPVTRRLAKNGAVWSGVQLSAATVGSALIDWKIEPTMPCEPTRSSLLTLPPRKVAPGPATISKMPLGPGLTVLITRLSAPAWKWQVAHAIWPSPPSWMSQNSALPSRTAAAWLTMSPPIGCGTPTLPSGAGPPPPPSANALRAAPPVSATATPPANRRTPGKLWAFICVTSPCKNRPFTLTPCRPHCPGANTRTAP